MRGTKLYAEGQEYSNFSIFRLGRKFWRNVQI